MKKSTIRPYTRRSSAEWSGILKAYSSSGMSEKKFCSEHGICLQSFRNWRVKLQKKSASRFVTFDIVDSPSSSWQAELVLPNGLVLRMGEDIARECIRDLLSTKKEG